MRPNELGAGQAHFPSFVRKQYAATEKPVLLFYRVTEVVNLLQYSKTDGQF